MAGRKPVDMGPAPELDGNGPEDFDKELEDLFGPDEEDEEKPEASEEAPVKQGQNKVRPDDVLFGGKAEKANTGPRDVSAELVQSLLSVVDTETTEQTRILIPESKREQVRQIQTLLRSHYRKAPQKASLLNIVTVAIDMMIEDMSSKGGKSKYFKRLSRL